MGKKQKKRKQAIPVDENPSARFVRVVTPRVNRAVKAIKQVGLCAGKNYDNTPEQLKQILDVLDSALGEMKAKYADRYQEEEVFDFKN